MKECKKCTKEFNPEKGLINYCSLKCRNSREWNKEDKLKKSESAKSSIKVKLSLELAKESRINRTPERWLEIKINRETKRKEKILNINYSELSFGRLRERIMFEQNNKCNNCKLDEWLGTPIPLELEHKDGNHYNNNRENLESLCPNCHSLTLTWRGRNKSNTGRIKVSDEKLLEALSINDWNMRQALIELNLAAKGGNYKRCHKLKREYFGNN